MRYVSNIRKRKISWQGWKYNSKSIERFWQKFKSEKELWFYMLLTSMVQDNKIDSFEYETEKFTLVDTIRYNWTTYPKTTYTPDFIVSINWIKIYIDTKSVITAKKESYRVKVKIFLEKYIVGRSDVMFMEVLSEKVFVEAIKNLD